MAAPTTLDKLVAELGTNSIPREVADAALAAMSDEQLQHELREAQQSLFRLRVQAATERNDVPSNVKKLRRDIARMFTVQRERELSKV